MSKFEMHLVLLLESIRQEILDVVKYFWWIDSILPMIPMLVETVWYAI